MGEIRPNPKHPAPFSDPIIEFIGRRVREEQRALGRPLTLLDPFAGVGRIHRLYKPGLIETWGIELEPEWAACHARNRVGDAMQPHTWGPMGRARIDVIATSVTYGNRFSDAHDAQDGSVRRSYTHDLGRPLHEHNSGAMPWGARYRRFHADAYVILIRRLRPGGLFILNVSGFIRHQEVVDAPLFHLGAALAAGFVETKPAVRIGTERMTMGSNRDRVAGEIVFQLRRPE